jgi:hypothetical protein
MKMFYFDRNLFFVQRLCPELRRSASHRMNNSSIESTPVDYMDEDSATFIALKRRQSNEDDEEQQRKISKLITDLTKSLDSISDQYDIRQVQQQFTIELPLPQPTHKHKLPYGENLFFHFVNKFMFI